MTKAEGGIKEKNKKHLEGFCMRTGDIFCTLI